MRLKKIWLALTVILLIWIFCADLKLHWTKGIGRHSSGNKLCRRCIDAKQYKSVITPLRSSMKKWDVVLLIISSHRKDALERREVIRKTWANTSIYLPVKIERLFILGEIK